MKGRRKFPGQLQDALGLRRRALRAFGAHFEYETTPEFAAADEPASERGQATLTLRVEGRTVVIRLHAWPDRWLWIDARHSRKGGWAWEYSAEGKFLPSQGARGVAENVERMMRAAHLPAAMAPEAMGAIWLRSLGCGTQRIHR